MINDDRVERNCGNCLHNDDLLCDVKGILVNDDDAGCKYYKTNEQVKKEWRK